MTTVTMSAEDLKRLEKAVDRLDDAEIELEAARGALGQTLRDVYQQGNVSIHRLQEITGFSRGHVYDLMGPVQVKLRRRKRRRESEDET